MRARPLTIASAMNPSAANGSISGQSAAKWCELRIATAAMPWRRALSRSSGALARSAGCAKPLRASVATSPGAASVDDRHCPAVDPAAFQRRDIARQAQQSVADGAVALGRDDGFGNRPGVFRRYAVAQEDPDDEIGQFIDADGLRHPDILGGAACRHNARQQCAEGEMAKIVIIGGGVIGSVDRLLPGAGRSCRRRGRHRTGPDLRIRRDAARHRRHPPAVHRAREHPHGAVRARDLRPVRDADGGGRRSRADRFPPRGLSVARLRQGRCRFADGELADTDRARCPRRIARPQRGQAPLPVDAGRRHRHRRLLPRRRLHGPALAC